MKTVVDSYVKKYGNTRRYTPTDPNDEFLANLTEWVVQYPVTSGNYTTPHLLVEWFNGDNFLLKLRAGIEIGRWKNPNAFTSQTRENVRAYLLEKYCNIGVSGTNVTGGAENEMKAKQDISLGYWGNRRNTDSLRRTGDTRCKEPIYPMVINQRLIVEDWTNKILEGIVLFIIPPGFAFSAPVQAVGTLIKMVKRANRTKKTLREVYKARKAAQAVSKARREQKALKETVDNIESGGGIGLTKDAADDLVQNVKNTAAAEAGTATTGAGKAAAGTEKAAGAGKTAATAEKSTAPAQKMVASESVPEAAASGVGKEVSGIGKEATEAGKEASAAVATTEKTAAAAPAAQNSEEVARLAQEAAQREKEAEATLTQLQQKYNDLQAKQEGLFGVFGADKRRIEMQNLSRQIADAEKELASAKEAKAIYESKQAEKAIGFVNESVMSSVNMPDFMATLEKEGYRLEYVGDFAGKKTYKIFANADKGADVEQAQRILLEGATETDKNARLAAVGMYYNPRRSAWYDTYKKTVTDMLVNDPEVMAAQRNWYQMSEWDRYQFIHRTNRKIRGLISKDHLPVSYGRVSSPAAGAEYGLQRTGSAAIEDLKKGIPIEFDNYNFNPNSEFTDIIEQMVHENYHYSQDIGKASTPKWLLDYNMDNYVDTDILTGGEYRTQPVEIGVKQLGKDVARDVSRGYFEERNRQLLELGMKLQQEENASLRQVGEKMVDFANTKTGSSYWSFQRSVRDLKYDRTVPKETVEYLKSIDDEKFWNDYIHHVQGY